MLNFPSSPTLNQEYTVGVKTWKWNGTVWQLVPVSTGAALASAASATAAAGSATAAANSASAASASYDSFDDRYLGAKAVAPTLDNDGNALLTGAVFWDTVSNQMFVWSGSQWKPTFLTGNAVRSLITATAGQTVFTVPTYVVAANTLQVFVNGIKVLVSSDYTETNQNTITFGVGLSAGDEVEVIALQPYAIGTTGAESVSFQRAESGSTLRNVSEKLKETFSVKDFGAVGDNVTDDTTALTNALAAAAGNILNLGSSKTYKVTAALTMSPNTTLEMNGSTINFVISGSTQCLLPTSGCSVLNGVVKNTGSSPSGAGQYQTPICIGNYGVGTGYRNILLSGLEIINNRPDGNGILITGASDNIVIDQLYGPGDATTGAFIVAHWGGADNPSAGTFHPSNISISNVNCGDYTYAGAEIVYIAASVNVQISNVRTSEVQKSVVTLFAGDYGLYYAPTNVKNIGFGGISVKNCRSDNSSTSGVIVDMQAPLAPGTPIYDVSGLVIDGCSTYGKTPAAAGNGFVISNAYGVKLRDCKATRHGTGVITGPNVERLVIDGGTYFANYNQGIYLNNGTVAPKSCTVRNAATYGNGTSAASSAVASGIFVGNGSYHVIENNVSGAVGEAAQVYGIRVVNGCVDVVVQNNYCPGLKNGGVAFSMGGSTSWVNRVFKGNVSEAISGGQIFDGPNPIVVDTVNRGNTLPNNKSYALFGTAAPSAGTWSVGDRVQQSTPVVGQPKGWVCTVAGTPGTWVSEGNL